MSVSARDERLAFNESIFRTANERMKAWEERHEHAQPETYHCECSDLECRDHVVLGAEQYEELRSDACCFVVAVGHAHPEVETVVERTEDYEVVRKDADVTHIVEATDPRA